MGRQCCCSSQCSLAQPSTLELHPIIELWRCGRDEQVREKITLIKLQGVLPPSVVAGEFEVVRITSHDSGVDCQTFKTDVDDHVLADFATQEANGLPQRGARTFAAMIGPGLMANSPTGRPAHSVLAQRQQSQHDESFGLRKHRPYVNACAIA